MERVNELKLRLEKEIGSKSDVLSLYREWLDLSNIKSEEEGMPSEEAYKDENIKRFIKDMQS